MSANGGSGGGGSGGGGSMISLTPGLTSATPLPGEDDQVRDMMMIAKEMKKLEAESVDAAVGGNSGSGDREGNDSNSSLGLSGKEKKKERTPLMKDTFHTCKGRATASKKKTKCWCVLDKDHFHLRVYDMDMKPLNGVDLKLFEKPIHGQYQADKETLYYFSIGSRITGKVYSFESRSKEKVEKWDEAIQLVKSSAGPLDNDLLCLFQKADEDKSFTLDFGEVAKLLKERNVQISAAVMRDKFEDVDQDGGGFLDFTEFETLEYNIQHDTEIEAIFMPYVLSEERQLMTEEGFRAFLRAEQGSNLSQMEIRELMTKYRPKKNDLRAAAAASLAQLGPVMDVIGFTSFLVSDDNPALRNIRNSISLDEPLSHYFICSALNPCYELSKLADPKTIFNSAIKQNCRYFEFEVYEKMGAIVFSSRVNKHLDPEKALTQISYMLGKEYSTPVILSFNVRCKPAMQARLLSILYSRLRDRMLRPVVVVPPESDGTMPSDLPPGAAFQRVFSMYTPRQIAGKVLVLTRVLNIDTKEMAAQGAKKNTATLTATSSYYLRSTPHNSSGNGPRTPSPGRRTPGVVSFKASASPRPGGLRSPSPAYRSLSSGGVGGTVSSLSSSSAAAAALSGTGAGEKGFKCAVDPTVVKYYLPQSSKLPKGRMTSFGVRDEKGQLFMIPPDNDDDYDLGKAEDIHRGLFGVLNLYTSTFAGVPEQTKELRNKCDTLNFVMHLKPKTALEFSSTSRKRGILRLFSEAHLVRAYHEKSQQPLDRILCGAQITPTSFYCTPGVTNYNSWVYRGFFQNYGFVPKPKWFYTAGPTGTPAPPPSENSTTLRVKVINARQLPKKEGEDTIDPFVTVEVFGYDGSDVKRASGVKNSMHTTAVVDNNGWDPAWNEEFSFHLLAPELDVLLFTVYDKDERLDTAIGYAALPCHLINKGYRPVHLNTCLGDPIPIARILCHFSMEKDNRSVLLQKAQNVQAKAGFKNPINRYDLDGDDTDTIPDKLS